MTELPNGWWSQRKDRIMRSRLRAGMDYAEVGALMGITGNQVMYRARNIGAPEGVSQMMTSDQMAEADQRYRDSLFVAALSEAYIRGEFP